MSKKDPKVAGDPQEPQVEPKADDPLSALSPEARKIFEETQSGLLSALQKEREANDKASKDLETLTKENQKRIEKNLQEQGKYKELAEERAQALAKIQPKADRLEAAEATLEKVLEAQIELIPEDKRALVPAKLSTQDQLEWISANSAALSKAKPVDVGAGKRGGAETKGVVLTSEQKEMAKKMDVSEVDYAKQLNK